MLSSRKIVIEKTLQAEHNSKTFVKALIKKSCGDATRRCFVLFKTSIQDQVHSGTLN